MSTFEAQQLIFTRVEAPYSPRHESGFQTYYRSPGLSPAAVAAIEERVKGYGILMPSESTPTRWQFFGVDNNQVVLARTVLIPPHAEILDPTRTDIHLAHCLILSQDQFARMGNQPFTLIENFRFLKDAKTMVSEYNQGTGTYTRAVVETDWLFRAPQDGARWGVGALSLVELGTKASQVKTQGKSLLVYGSTAEILDTLRLAFYLTPAEYRPALSFDTHSVQRRIPPGQYWALGAPEIQFSQAYWIVHSKTGRVEEVRPTINPDDFYLAWLDENLRRDPETALQQAIDIQEITLAFRNPGWPLPAGLTDAAIESFFRQFKVPLERRLLKIVGRNFSPQIAQDLLAVHFAELFKRNLLEIAAAQRPDPVEYSIFVRNWLLRQSPEFTAAKKDWGNLAAVAQEFRDYVLMFWVGLISGNDKLRKDGLAGMSDDGFQEALQLFGQPVQYPEFLFPPHARALARKIGQSRSIEGNIFVRLVNDLIAVDGGKTLDELAECVFQLDQKSLTPIEHKLEKAPQAAPGFRLAVRQQRSKLGPNSSLLDKAAKWLNEDINPFGGDSKKNK